MILEAFSNLSESVTFTQTGSFTHMRLGAHCVTGTLCWGWSPHTSLSRVCLPGGLPCGVRVLLGSLYDGIHPLKRSCQRQLGPHSSPSLEAKEYGSCRGASPR